MHWHQENRDAVGFNGYSRVGDTITAKFDGGYEVTYPPITLTDGSTAPGFPDFPNATVPEGEIAVAVSIQLPVTDILRESSDFRSANAQLARLIDEGDPSILDLPEEVREWALLNRANGKSPRSIGYVWHHVPSTADFEFANATLHDFARHVGGDATWGNGALAR